MPGQTAMRFLRKILSKDHKVSYSQCGEDLIIRFLFKALNITNPSYLDIGAHDPVYENNTYLFYRQGCRGVCVEPNPVVFRLLKHSRRRDTCLNVGVGSRKGLADYYVMTASTLNTFSKKEAQRVHETTHAKIDRVTQLPMVPVNEIIEENFDAPPNLLSLDVEGLEKEILTGLDLARIRPHVICVETLSFESELCHAHKRNDLVDLVLSQNYVLYADTYVNSIFVAQEFWKARLASSRIVKNSNCGGPPP